MVGGRGRGRKKERKRREGYITDYIKDFVHPSINMLCLV